MSALRLVYPVLMLAVGLLMLFAPRRFMQAKQREYRDRLAEREARGTDAYFEELRELKAYPPSRIAGPWQMLGIVLTICGGFLIYGAVTRP
ncbi:MAG: hypothetical protein JO276_14150 [Sphingomonadaceae bacterium]|nr:hypothetical protein [Sphingomonadaceae bacterium]